jgi:beta-xylosidase
VCEREREREPPF